jgi:hypothetical protein
MSLANGSFSPPIISIGTVVPNVLTLLGVGRSGLPTKFTDVRKTESFAGKSKLNGIDSISKIAGLVRKCRKRVNRILPLSLTYRARAIRTSLLTKNLVAIGQVVIDASHLRLSRRSKNSVALGVAMLYVV